MGPGCACCVSNFFFPYDRTLNAAALRPRSTVIIFGSPRIPEFIRNPHLVHIPQTHIASLSLMCSEPENSHLSAPSPSSPTGLGHRHHLHHGDGVRACKATEREGEIELLVQDHHTHSQSVSELQSDVLSGFFDATIDTGTSECNAEKLDIFPKECFHHQLCAFNFQKRATI